MTGGWKPLKKGPRSIVRALNMLGEMVSRLQPIEGRGTRVTEGPGGTLIEAYGTGGASAGAQAFYRTYNDGADHYIQGGQVTAGTYNTTVADATIGTVGAEPADGTDVYLEVTGNGVVDSGVLLQGFTGTAASIASAASVPANTLPAYDDSTGKKCHVLLGTWNGGSFAPSGPGHVNVSFCPGAYTVTRF